MYATMAQFNAEESFSMEVGNAFSDKATQVIGALSWGMRCNIPLDEAMLTLRTRQYRDTCLNKTIVWEQKFSWNRDITRTADDLKNGLPLYEAIRHLKQYFPPYVQSAIREAERMNVIEKVLPLLRRQMSYSAGVSQQRMASFTYPAMQFFQCLGLASGIMLFILPKLQRIYIEVYGGAVFPAITQAVLDFSSYAPLIAFFVLCLFPSFVILRLLYKFEPCARFAADFCLLHLPFIGQDMRKMALLELAGSMACYTDAGLDIIKAAELSNETMSSLWLRKRLRVFIEQTKNGKNWIDAWDEMNIGSHFYNWIARNAASREKVTEGFMQMMQWLRNDISRFSRIFIKAVEIFGILFNAVFVGFIVLGFGYGLFHLVYVIAAGANTI